MNSGNSFLATVTLLPLRATVSICHWFGWLIISLCKWLSVVGVCFAGIWLVLGLIYFILTTTGVVSAFDGFGFSEWWWVFFASLLSPFVWLLVMLSPLAWTSYIILTDEGMSRLALGTLGVALSGLVLWTSYKIARKVVSSKTAARHHRAAGRTPGPIS